LVAWRAFTAGPATRTMHLAGRARHSVRAARRLNIPDVANLASRG